MNAKTAVSGLVRYLTTFAAYCVAVMVSTWVVPVRAELMAQINAMGPSFMAITMLSFAIGAFVLYLFLTLTRWRGIKLAAGLFILFWGVLYLMSQVESLLFSAALTSMTTRDMGEIVLRGLVSTGISVPFSMLFTGRFKKSGETRSTLGRLVALHYAWKIPVAAAIFVVLYWLFGYFVAWQFPALRQYYSGSSELVPFFRYTAGMLSGQPGFFLIQFGRGFLWAGLALLSVLMVERDRLHSVIAAASIFVLFGLQLLIPNPMMPDFVRVPHLIETTSSMLLYGAFLGWFLHPRRAARAPEVIQLAA